MNRMDILREKYYRYPFPWFTLVLSLACIAIYLSFQIASVYVQSPAKLYTYLGAPYAIQLYAGQYWGIVTNSLLHVMWHHLLISLLGFWLFAAFLERRMGKYKLFLLGLIASLVSSAWQLTFSNDAGLGATGVNVALFGYIVSKSRWDSKFYFRKIFQYMLAFIIVLSVYFYYNLTKSWSIGISSILSGFLFGLIIGWSEKKKLKVFYSIGLIILGTSIASLFYAPWSPAWLNYRGIKYHEENNPLLAEKYYLKSLKIDPYNKIATKNMILLQIDSLSQLAYNAHYTENYSLARKYYLKILALDKRNGWARENLRKLP
jgi:membrane associated rhomboid family serine protease